MSILARRNPNFAAWQTETAQTICDSGPFVPRGGATSMLGLAQGTALPAHGEAWDYDPAALTLTVAAGVPVAQVDEMLRQEKQRLAFEPPAFGALLGRTGVPTIGGVIAGNLSGPRRVGVGACRDFCLGVGIIDGRGRIIKNGGRVMKNVTGLDLVKLMAGSHGALGLITDVSLKVQPIPEVSATLVVEGLTDPQAVAALSRALGTPFDVTGAAHLREAQDGTPARTLVRLEGFESSVAYRMSALQAALAGFGDSGVEWDETANRDIWANIKDVARFHSVAGDVWRVAVKPSDAPALVEAVQPLDAIYDWGGGRVWMLTDEGTDPRPHIGAGHATLVRASDETKRALGVFHPEHTIVAKLSDGLRQKFDPDQKFNRGMMR
ncbi:FAD-binding protein [Celeribacter marinus]|uniref:Glycolate dehydrogenase, FAD-binding subunit GlcE n=1 Tax=Celeribacter marinus TaxID=1397108 RepID=A0A0P0AAE2_9RHOB|nr:FAD-binding protein [Celeribacter marinus]ALI55113.1 glycolate dehydrogenase, FAD-binding subunit GlcE [Celeribacter marinus]SFK07367.1 glycolate oxidase FAD binding subunit [Celeribacter marinus]